MSLLTTDNKIFKFQIYNIFKSHICLKWCTSQQKKCMFVYEHISLLCFSFWKSFANHSYVLVSMLVYVCGPLYFFSMMKSKKSRVIFPYSHRVDTTNTVELRVYWWNCGSDIREASKKLALKAIILMLVKVRSLSSTSYIKNTII